MKYDMETLTKLALKGFDEGIDVSKEITKIWEGVEMIETK